MRRMRQGRRIGCTTLVILATTGGAGFAQETTTPPISLEEMATRLAELEERNQALQGRVNELEGAEGEAWLSEQRAQEIRGIVTDVLADAETRTSLQSSGMTAGWDDGFFLQSPDGRFRLNVGGMLQVRYLYSNIRTAWTSEQGSQYQYEDRAPNRFGWDVPFARLDFSGNVFGPDTTFELSGEFANIRGQYFTGYTPQPIITPGELGDRAGALSLLDAWIAHEIADGWTVKVGQFKLPFDRGWEVSIANQLTGNRTATAYHFGLGRSQGLELGYEGDDIRWRTAVSEGANDRLFYAYRLAVTEPKNSPYFANQSDLSVSSRLEWKLAGAWEDFDRMTSPPGEEFGLLAGLGVHWQRNKVYLNEFTTNQTRSGPNNPPFSFPQSANNYNDWIGITADLSVQLGGASITASGYYHSVDSGASYLVRNFGLVGGSSGPTFSGNPTFDVGTVQLVGGSLYGAMYVVPEVELFAGVDWMEVIGGGGLSALDTTASVQNFDAYLAYQDSKAYFGITAGGTWYVDGEDVKVGASVTFSPQTVSPNWATPALGIRTTPTSDMFVLGTYFQLLF